MLFIRSVDLILTEKCSLKCKDCANLMQYYEKPINIESEELIGDLHDICSIADEINEIRRSVARQSIAKQKNRPSARPSAFQSWKQSVDIDDLYSDDEDYNVVDDDEDDVNFVRVSRKSSSQKPSSNRKSGTGNRKSSSRKSDAIRRSMSSRSSTKRPKKKKSSIEML